MKLGGIRVSGPRVETVVIPFGNRELVFKAQLVGDFSDFEKLCPRPIPPTIQRPGQPAALDVEDKDYKIAISKWATHRTQYTILKSLQATPELEFETIKMNDPETWGNFSQEFKEAGLSPQEIACVINIVWAANGLDQDKINEATKRFLAGEAAAKQNPSSQVGAQSGMPSGAPAKD